MIAFLEGVLEEALPTQIIVNVHGVGYHVMIPLSSFERLSEPGSPVKILTHLVVREDSHVLYGFGTVGERDLFRLLLNNVSGVGPKLALAILSGMSVEMFKAAVVSGDIAAISRIKGVGKKTAERVVLELKDKVGVAAEWEAASAANAPSERDQAVHDAVLALISLGYKQLEAHKAIKQCLAESSDPPASDESRQNGSKDPGMSPDKVQRAEAIRSALPEGGLFHEKSWRVSPDAFVIDPKFAEELDRLGYRLLRFVRACNQLYRFSVSGRQPAWIAELLDRGKPRRTR